MSENELDARIEQLYRRVSAGLHHDRLTSVWVRFAVRADTDAAALALVRDQVQTGRDRGAAVREVRVDPPRRVPLGDAVPVLPLDQSEPTGEASV